MKTTSTCCLPILFLRAHSHLKLNHSCVFRLLHQRGSVPQQQHAPIVPPPESSSYTDLLERVARLSPKKVKWRDTAVLCQLSRLLTHSPKAAKEAWGVKGVVSGLVRLQSCGMHDIEEQARHSLALLGYAPPYSGRGLRILSVDGGGTRWVVFGFTYFIFFS